MFSALGTFYGSTERRVLWMRSYNVVIKIVRKNIHESHRFIDIYTSHP